MASVGITAKLRRFGRIGPRRRGWLVEAALWLAVARLAMLTIPFPRLAPLLGSVSPPGGEDGGMTSDQAAIAREIGWAVTRAARHLPFEALCLPQAIAAKRMLRRRGIPARVYLGSARDPDGRPEAHAWVIAAGIEVTGFPEARRFVPVSCFT